MQVTAVPAGVRGAHAEPGSRWPHAGLCSGREPGSPRLTPAPARGLSRARSLGGESSSITLRVNCPHSSHGGRSGGRGAHRPHIWEQATPSPALCG